MSQVQSPRQVVLTEAGRRYLEGRIADVRREVEASPAAEDDPGLQQGRIAELERLEDSLRHSVMVHEIQEDPTIVEVGDEVHIETEDGENTVVLIVHGVDARMHADRISPDSPMALALLGGRPGDQVTVQAPGGAYAVQIIGRQRLS